MTLERNNIIQVNVIIIMGLLVLLSVQSLSSTAYETQVVNAFDRMVDVGIKSNKINSLFEENCMNPTINKFTYLNSTDIENLCKTLEIQLDEINHESKALNLSLESWSILKNNTATDNARTILWGSMNVKVVTLFMLLPFIGSTICEVSRKTKTLDASNASVSIFLIGMCGLIFGIVIILGIIIHSLP